MPQINFVYIRNDTVLNTSATINVLSYSPAYWVTKNLIFLQNGFGLSIYLSDPAFTFVKNFTTNNISKFSFYNYEDLLLYTLDSQNFYLVNKTNNFSVIYQGFANQIKMLAIFYPYYIIIYDNNSVIHQIDIQIKQIIYSLNITLSFD
jgi:hypothetical protein